ncbi:DUF3089 domain-containing protein [Oribacterium sp. WCC10]|uniref:DUF3089 domain-containing protein n=1 Tax=Oribacterium sp. WCC10 TaxID=1855343 RepID=UPI000B87657A|nr:DUF3089 domain-containing protein [Oribacterium sp. WCC10]
MSGCNSQLSVPEITIPAAETETDSGESNAEAPDYSQEDCWLQIPEITKDVDTFYIYSTVYVDSSFEDGAPDYASLDTPEMIAGALGEYVTNASVYEDSTNVFVPFYRQPVCATHGKSPGRPETLTQHSPVYPTMI